MGCFLYACEDVVVERNVFRCLLFGENSLCGKSFAVVIGKSRITAVLFCKEGVAYPAVDIVHIGLQNEDILCGITEIS